MKKNYSLMTIILLKRNLLSKRMEKVEVVRGFVFISLILILVGLVNSAIAGVVFVAPNQNFNISGDTYLINWTNTGNIPGLYLQSAPLGCNGTFTNLTSALSSSVTTHNWDTSALNGAYCLRLYDNVNNVTYSGNFTVDNSDPVADLSAGEPYTCAEGGSVLLNASSSYDNETGIDIYEWDFDGDGFDDGLGETIIYACGDGPSTPTITLRVRDYSNNSDTDNTIVNITNLAPVCSGISAVADAAITEPVIFTENASDVIDSLTYSWNFGDGGMNTSGSAVSHTYMTGGNYNVTVNVSDGDDTCLDSVLIDIVAPTVLAGQEVMALNNLTTEFGASNGSSPNSFATGLTGGVICAKRITNPDSMSVTGSGNDCVITWNDINNSDNGINPMVVKVSNATDYEYYTFNTTVYSWMIPLIAGWNLVSIPVTPENNTVENVFLEPLSNSLPGGFEYVIWSYQWDGNQNVWKKTRKSGFGDLDFVEPGRAYWINMSNADVLKGFGDKLTAAQTPPSKTIVGGWNLIGHYGLLTVSLANSLVSISGYYTTVLDESGFPPGSLTPGEGYWLSANLLNGQEIEYTPSNSSYNFN